MKNKLTLGIMALGVIALLGISLVAAFPMMNGKWDVTEEEMQEQRQFMEQVQNAIENEDFAKWESLMMSQITLENFNEHVARHQEMLQNQEEMEEQRQLCLENPEDCPYAGEGRGQGKGMMGECTENPEDCPYAGQGNGQGQMHKEFNQDMKQQRWAFWKGFGKNRA